MESKDNLEKNKRIAKNTAFLYIRMVLVLLVAIYTSRLLLSSLGISDYGIYNVVAGFVSMFAVLNSALTSCVQRYYNFEIGKNGEHGITRVYTTAVQIQVILMGLAVTLAEVLGIWYIQNKLVVPADRFFSAKMIFHFSVLSMAFTILQVPYSAAIIAKEKMDYYAIVGIIDIILRLLSAIIINYISTDRLIYYGLLICGVSLIDFLLYFVYAKIKITSLRIKLKFYRDLFKEMLQFSGWSSLSGFAQMMRNQGLNLILNLFYGPTVNAARAISYQVKAALIGFVQNISAASRPQLIESYAKGETGRSLSLMYSISKICYIFLLIMLVPISLEIDYILTLWLGSNFPEHTNTFTILVLIITSVDILQTPVSMLIYANGNIAKYNIYTSLIGIMVLPLGYFSLKMGFCPESVYYASLLISILIQVVSIFLMIKLKLIDQNQYIDKVINPLLKVTFVSILLPLFVRFILDAGLLRVLLVLLSSIISILIVTYKIGLSSNEKALVKKISYKYTKNISCK